jgi:hypothetical protein
MSVISCAFKTSNSTKTFKEFFGFSSNFELAIEYCEMWQKEVGDLLFP